MIIIHKYILFFFWQILLGLVLILGPLFFMFPLFSLGRFGLLVLAITLFFGILLTFRWIYNWYKNIFIITDQKLIIIDQKSLFERIITEHLYQEIKNIRVITKGFLQTSFKFGSLFIELEKSNKIVIAKIKKPQKVADIILECKRKEQELEKRVDTSSQEAIIEILKKLKKEVGKEKIVWLLNKLDK